MKCVDANHVCIECLQPIGPGHTGRTCRRDFSPGELRPPDTRTSGDFTGSVGRYRLQDATEYWLKVNDPDYSKQERRGYHAGDTTKPEYVPAFAAWNGYWYTVGGRHERTDIVQFTPEQFDSLLDNGFYVDAYTQKPHGIRTETNYKIPDRNAPGRPTLGKSKLSPDLIALFLREMFTELGESLEQALQPRERKLRSHMTVALQVLHDAGATRKNIQTATSFTGSKMSLLIGTTRGRAEKSIGKGSSSTGDGLSPIYKIGRTLRLSEHTTTDVKTAAKQTAEREAKNILIDKLLENDARQIELLERILVVLGDPPREPTNEEVWQAVDQLIEDAVGKTH